MSLYGLPALPQARFGYINVECIMFQREDPAFVRRVFLQPQARRRSGAAGGASITRAAAKGCTAGSAGGHRSYTQGSAAGLWSITRAAAKGCTAGGAGGHA